MKKIKFSDLQGGGKKSYSAAKKLTVGLGEQQCHLKKNHNTLIFLILIIGTFGPYPHRNHEWISAS